MNLKNNDTDRRSFIQKMGTLAAGAMVLPHVACGSSKAAIADMSKPSLDKYGVQLYTLRDVIPEDPKGVLKQLASFGFKQIEGYEGPQGMFWDMPHKDFKMYMDDLGMKMVASHCNINENFEEKVGQAVEIGMDYLVCPYIGPQTSIENWKKVTDKFNKCGKICKDAGINFAYHNHAYSFVPFSGMIPHDFLMENTDPELVDHEMDIYWVVTGGADPIEYLTKYPNRFRLCHVKDRLKTASPDEREASCDLGTGSIDYPKILKVARDNGMKYFILEQERYDNSTSIKSAKVGSEYLKKVVFT